MQVTQLTSNIIVGYESAIFISNISLLALVQITSIQYATIPAQQSLLNQVTGAQTRYNTYNLVHTVIGGTTILLNKVIYMLIHL